MVKVLISDKMSPLAEQIFKERGVEVDFKPGMTPDELKACIGEYDGLAIRSATKATADIIAAASVSRCRNPCPGAVRQILKGVRCGVVRANVSHVIRIQDEPIITPNILSATRIGFNRHPSTTPVRRVSQIVVACVVMDDMDLAI